MHRCEGPRKALQRSLLWVVSLNLISFSWSIYFPFLFHQKPPHSLQVKKKQEATMTITHDESRALLISLSIFGSLLRGAAVAHLGLLTQQASALLSSFSLLPSIAPSLPHNQCLAIYIHSPPSPLLLLHHPQLLHDLRLPRHGGRIHFPRLGRLQARRQPCPLINRALRIQLRRHL